MTYIRQHSKCHSLHETIFLTHSKIIIRKKLQQNKCYANPNYSPTTKILKTNNNKSGYDLL